MLCLELPRKAAPLRVLCLGAHSDDIEIGCAASLRMLAERHGRLLVHWMVLSAPHGPRLQEARASAAAWLTGIAELDFRAGAFPDTLFPAVLADLKARFGQLSTTIDPDLIFTHALHDRHQDHRLVAELTWQTWRNHLILEYEIPKYEGDLAQPNVYVAVSQAIAQAKCQHLEDHFASQRSKDWFDGSTFRALMRIRGLECRAPDGLAEAFHARKLMF